MLLILWKMVTEGSLPFISRGKAKAEVALTMIGGSTNIAPESPSVFGQLYAGDDTIIPWFQRLTDGVKSHGAAVMCQITIWQAHIVG